MELQAGLAYRIASDQLNRRESSPGRSPPQAAAVAVDARCVLSAISRMGQGHLNSLVQAAQAAASKRPVHLRAKSISPGYVSMLLQLLQQHFVAVGEPNLLETMSSLRQSAKKVLVTILEGLDTVKRDIERHDEGLQKSLLSRLLAVASFGQMDILDLSQGLQLVAKHVRAFYVDFWGHLLPSAPAAVLSILRQTQTLSGYTCCCCCVMCINYAADAAQQEIEGMQPGDRTSGAGEGEASDDASSSSSCCNCGSCFLSSSELVFGRRRNEPAVERLQYAALRLSDVFGLERDVISFAKGDLGGGGERGLHESALLQSIKRDRQDLLGGKHRLHLAHVELLIDQPRWWHGTLLRLALVADSAARFATGRAEPDYQRAYRRALTAAIRLH